MGGFFLLRNAIAAPGTAQALANSFKEQGFGRPRVIEAAGASLHLYPKLATKVPPAEAEAQGFRAAAVGTMLYGGRGGGTALSLFLADWLAGRVDPDACMGFFAAFLVDEEGITVIPDPLGQYPVFAPPDGRFLTSSFLAAAGACKRLTGDVQGIYEYAFLGAPHGETTLVREVRRLDMGGAVRVTQHGIDRIPEAAPLVPGFVADGRDTHLERAQAALDPVCGAIRAAFPLADSALSGGCDSRLLLALLRSGQIPTRLHVYGGRTDVDVKVAKAIAMAEALALDHVDKDAAPLPDPDAFAHEVERIFLAFDGCPTDGIFDVGDLPARTDRVAGGAVALNGGGGEIFRNFFYVPDSRLTPRDMVWTFWSQHDPSMCTDRFNEEDYSAALDEKLRRAAGSSEARLGRDRIDLLYPAFRCRFWTAWNTAINNRLGPALTPFLSRPVVQAALRVPPALRRHGLFEAQLMARIDPRLAAYGSAYGHDFLHPPPLSRVVRDLATELRPPRLRRLGYRLRHRRPVEVPRQLTGAWLAAVLPPPLVHAPVWFRLDTIRDAAWFKRVMTLEYLFRRLGVVHSAQ